MMPKRRDDLVTLPPRRRGGRPGKRWNWESLADGAVWELFQGTDYTDPYDVRALSSQYARRNRLTVGVRDTGGGTLLIQFTPRPPRRTP